MPRAELAGNHLALTHALGCLARAAVEAGQTVTAERLAERAAANSEVHGFRHHWATAMAHLAAGKVQLTKGNLVGASASVERAVDLSRRGLARIELAYGLVTLADIAWRLGERDRAADLLAEADAALDRCRDPGVVAALAARISTQIGTGPHRMPRVARTGDDLSDRELAVLCLLPTTLTLRKLAGTLYVSINTIKSQLERSTACSACQTATRQSSSLSPLGWG